MQAQKLMGSQLNSASDFQHLLIHLRYIICAVKICFDRLNSLL